MQELINSTEKYTDSRSSHLDAIATDYYPTENDTSVNSMSYQEGFENTQAKRDFFESYYEDELSTPKGILKKDELTEYIRYL
jgi:hypothetical protein